MTAAPKHFAIRRLAVLSLVAAFVAAVVVPAVFAAADAKAPDGSVAEVILEPALTGDPTRAIHQGWWGHGTRASLTKTGTTFVSLDLADAKGKVTTAATEALGRLFDDKTLENLRVAFVPYSPDGSNERPKVTKGENAGEAFEWFTDYGFGTAFNGAESDNDSVITVSTLNEWTAWWKIGRPLEGYLPDLSVVTIDAGGQTEPATAPEGKSILNRWPAGRKISMVFYLSDGYDKKYPLIPRVAVGPDGRAISAWLTFRTVAHPTDEARTSAGFDVLTYSPPSAYPGGGKSGAEPGSDPNENGSSDKGQTGDGSGSGDSGSTSDGDKSALSKVADAVPGGIPVLVLILALVAAGVVIGTGKLRMRTPQDAEVPPAPDSIPNESPANGRR